MTINKEQLPLPTLGDIWQFVETFLIVTMCGVEGKNDSHLVGKDQGAAYPPIMYRAAPTAENCLAQNVKCRD